MRIYFILILSLISLLSSAQEDALKAVLVEVERTVKPSETHKIQQFSSAQLNQFSTQSLSDLLSKASGVFIKSYGLGNIATPSIRGTGASHTQVYWNGIQINSPTLGQSDLSILPITFFNSAEMHLGSSSIADGSGGIGGALQLSNNLSYDTTLIVNAQHTLGSFGMNSSSLSTQFGSFKIQSSTKLYRNEGSNDFKYKDLSRIEQPYINQVNGYYKQFGVGQDVSFKITPKQELEFKSLFFNSYRQISPTIGVNSNGEYQEDDSRKLLLGWNIMRNKSSHNIKIANMYDELNYTDTVADIYSSVKTNVYSANYNAVLYLSNFKIKYALSHQKEEAISSGFIERKTRSKSAGFLQVEHKLGEKWLYHLAARQEYIDTILSPFSPSVGLKYKATKKSSVSLNASKTYRVPSLNDLYWSLGGKSYLLPESGYSSELNYEHTLNLKKNTFTYNISGFYSLVDNWIQWTPTQFGYWSPSNLKKVLNRGIESNLNFSRHLKGNNWVLNANVNYSFTKSTTIESNSVYDQSIDKQLIYVPKHTFNFNASITYKQMNLSYFQTYTSAVFIDASNSTYLPYYAPADISLTYSTKGSVRTQYGLKVINLYNEEYQVVANRPLPMRYFNVFIRFNIKE